jgi:hypothetical protein
VTAPTAAQAFEHLYFLERAAQTLMLACAIGQPINVLTEEIAERTARDWLAYDGMAFEHFEQLKLMLNRTTRLIATEHAVPAKSTWRPRWSKSNLPR